MRAHPSLAILGTLGKKNVAVDRIYDLLMQKQIYYMSIHYIEEVQAKYVYKSSNALWEGLDATNLSFLPKKFNRSKHFSDVKGVLPVFYDDLLEIFDIYQLLILKVNILILVLQSFQKFF